MKFFFSLFAILLTQSANADARVNVSDFASGELDGWEAKSFKGETDYQLVDENGSLVLLATSNGDASGLGKKITVDLNRTPYLNWSWKVNTKLDGLDETAKSGDDYVARIYVVKLGGVFIWKTKALNYVWSSNQTMETMWDNAFKPKNAVMLAVRGESDTVGEWVTEKRNVREDMRRAFGADFDEIGAIAIMTDTDNSGRTASALYGEMFFTAD